MICFKYRQNIIKMRKLHMNSNSKGIFYTINYFSNIIWKHSKMYFLLFIIYTILNSINPFVTMVVTRNILSELSGAKNVQYLISQVIIAVSSLLFVTVGCSLLDYLMNNKILVLDDIFRENMGKKAMNMDFAYTENVKILELSERATTGMSFYSGGIKGIMTNLVTIISKILVFLGTTYIISKLNFFIIIILFALTVLNCLIQFKIKALDRNFWNSAVGINRTYSYFCDMAKDFRCGKDIRLHNAKELVFYELDKFTEEFDEFSSRHFSKLSFLSIFEVFFIASQLLVIFIFITRQTVNGYFTIAEFTLYISAAILFTTSLKETIEQTLELRKKAFFTSEYVNFMNIQNEINSGSTLLPNSKNFELEFVNVSFHYPNKPEIILDQVSLKIKKGEKLSIVGLNGAGKTTLIKLMIRLYDPTEGKILLNGIDIKEYDYKKYLEIFSVVFQDFSLFAFSVKENIVVNQEFEENRLKQAIEKAGIEEKINKLDRNIDTSLYKIFDEEGVEFSGGESQKLAIARAYYKDAPIIVLDEPTSALDPYAEAEIYSKLNELVQDKTAIYISHRMSSCKLCDRIIVLHKGKIIEEGTHNQLISNNLGSYYELYNAQAEYYK